MVHLPLLHPFCIHSSCFSPLHTVVDWTVCFFSCHPTQAAMKHSVFILAHFLSASALAATCYYPNGNSSIHDKSVPCSTLNGEVSMCCDETDKCLTNGLCKYSGSSGVANSEVLYWRDTCSNSDWTNPRCLNRCTVCSR